MSTTRARPPVLNAFLSARSAVIGLCRVAFLGLRHVTAAPLTALGHGGVHEPEADGPGLVFLYILSAILVVAGGAFAGLTIAFMGQDGIYLKVLKDDIHESSSKRRAAEKVLNLLTRGKHWVLVTLLLANVVVNESLPVVLDRCLGGGIAAIIGSTVLIVIFGEVVPQSICVRYGLPIGGFMAPAVLLLMWITAPVSWPMAKLLDYILGTHEGTVYKKSGLKTLVTLHQTIGEVNERLNTDEVTIIRAVLDLKDKPVGNIMTPMVDVFTLSADAVLDEKLMGRILSAGYSRIPVHQPGNPTNFVGMLLVKILITYDPEDCMQVKDFPLAALPETRPETSCLDILNYFQDGKSHMALVSSAPGQDHGAAGVVTLEDVIEELIGEEIIDESDVYIDVHKAIRRLAPAPTTMLFRRDSVHADKTAREQNLPGEGRRSTDSRKPDIAVTGPDGEGPPASPKTVTFMMKRTSGGVDGVESSTIPVKNMDQLRQHLRHLGPSNPASNPKNTTSPSVTVKPGSSAMPSPASGPAKDIRRAKSALAIVHQPEAEEGDESDEETPLLASKMTPKDKESHLTSGKLGYGTADSNGSGAPKAETQAITTQSVRSDGSVTITPGDDLATSLSKGRSSEPQSPQMSRSNTSSTNNNNNQNDNSGNGGGINFESPSRPTMCRTGAITESYVETGGVRKVVISASSGDEEDEAAASAGGSPVAQPTPPIAITTTTTKQPGAEDNGEAHDLLDVVSPSTEASTSTVGQGQGGGVSGRKNKKKRKGGKKK